MMGRELNQTHPRRGVYGWLVAAMTAVYWVLWLLAIVPGQILWVLLGVVASGLLFWLFHLPAAWWDNMGRRREIAICLFVFAVALALRLLCAGLLDRFVVQESDFAKVMEHAHTNDYADTASHYIMYPKILHVLFQMFGESQLVALLFNGTVGAVVTLLVYILGRRLFGPKAGAVAGILYACCPSMVLFTLLTSPDHCSALFLLLAVLLFLAALRQAEAGHWLPALAAGVACGGALVLLDYFKPYAMVLCVAFFCTAVGRILCKKEGRRRVAAALAVCLVLLGCVYGFGKRQASASLRMESGSQMNLEGSILNYLYVGLYSGGDGMYNQPLYAHYGDLLEETGTAEAANEALKQELLQDLDAHWRTLPRRLLSKLQFGFSSDSGINKMVINVLSEKGPGAATLVERVAKPVGNLYYLVLALCSLFCVLWLCWVRGEPDRFLPALVILGVLCQLLLVEMQGRYKNVIEPLLAVYAGGFLTTCPGRMCRRRTERDQAR